MNDIVRVAGINMELLDSTKTFPNEGRVACQGVKGAYSQQAANRMFAKSMPMFFKTFSGVIEAVKSGMVDYGIPFDPCEKWHFNRLMTLIEVCSIKNQPPKKMKQKDWLPQRNSLNKARRAKAGHHG